MYIRAVLTQTPLVMMKHVAFIAVAAAGLFIASCGQTQQEQPQVAEETPVTEEVAADAALDTVAYVAKVNAHRADVEARLGELNKREVSTETMRAKVRQKWSAIHYYADAAQVVRVKTYPHESVSKRTEEFYFMDGQLVLVVIEDDGTGERGKAEADVDKMYYFADGKVVKETSKGTEKEYAIKDSDGEELLQEANEYLDAYASMQ